MLNLRENNLKYLFIISFTYNVVTIVLANSEDGNYPGLINAEGVNYPEKLALDERISEDGKLNFTGLAAKYGYPAEEHHVVTEDGYILMLFHIPGDQDKEVLLVHGSTVDADCFVMRGNISLAITLASKGYDVWVLSYRGTIYSQRHKFIDPVKESNLFFDFSFYEIGIYDIPATIDYILEKTGSTQLLVIGYSVGTQVFFVLGSEKPEYNDKIKALIALAPICFSKNQRGVSPFGNNLGFLIGPLLTYANVSELVGRNQMSTYLYQKFCLGGILSYTICVRADTFGRFGPDEEGFEPEFLSTYFGHCPGGATTKLYIHTSQVYTRNKFAQYDYGTSKNLQVYNSTEPPEFDLSKVTMKVALLVGEADYLSTPKDVERLKAALPNVDYDLVLPYKNFNHFDFVLGRYMDKNLYPWLLKLVKAYI